jgi:tetratricopeptide (TPR) repeat protein
MAGPSSDSVKKSGETKAAPPEGKSVGSRLAVVGGTAGVVAILFGLILLLRSGGGEITLVYPFEGSLFPPEIIPPTVVWEDTNDGANRWEVTAALSDGTEAARSMVDTAVWTPTATQWEVIKAGSVDAPATISVAGKRSFLGLGRTLASASVSIGTSRDSVGAPIYYRDVPLPFRYALRNVPMIRWRLGSVSSPEPPPVVLENLPVCGNCHSFSGDGKYLGMDVDVGSDKGAYAFTQFASNTVLDKSDLISWSDYQRGRKVPTFGMLPRVSPDGRYVLAGVKDRAVFLPREDILFSQIFFPVMGILAYYDQATGEIRELPGADDEAFVQSNGMWSPDGEWVVFARAKAAVLETESPVDDILLTLKEAAEILGGEEHLFSAQEGGEKFLFDLYRVPFNGGRGGQAEPIPGASNNGASNFFPTISPDGKWLVFTQAHSFMLLQPDSRLFIMPAEGGEARLMRANTNRMNSWHSWSPNSRWLVFSTKVFGPYTQLMLTHIDENGVDSPPVLLRNFTAPDRAANIPEFVNIDPEETRVIEERIIDDYSYFRSGRIYQQFHEYDRAEEEFRKSLQMNPRNPQTLFSLAEIYAEEGDFREARASLEAVLEVDPNSSAVHAEMGNLHFLQEEYPEAEAELRQAVGLDPANVEAQFNLGVVLLTRGNIQEAHLVLHRLQAGGLEPEAARRVHERLSAIHIMQQDYQGAVEHLEAILAVDPENLDAHFNLGLSLMSLEDLEAARDQFEAVTRLDPEDAAAHGRLGEVYAAMGDRAGAMAQFGRVVELEPRDVQGLAQLSRLYYEAGEMVQAERTLTRLVSVDPSHAWGQVSLGRVFLETAQYSKAAQQFSRITEMAPNDARNWFMLGETLMRESRSPEEAIRAFERGLSLDPGYAEGHAALGDLYLARGDATRALQCFRNALVRCPEDSPLAAELQTRIADLERGTGR